MISSLGSVLGNPGHSQMVHGCIGASTATISGIASILDLTNVTRTLKDRMEKLRAKKQPGGGVWIPILYKRCARDGEKRGVEHLRPLVPDDGATQCLRKPHKDAHVPDQGVGFSQLIYSKIALSTDVLLTEEIRHQGLERRWFGDLLSSPHVAVREVLT